MKVYVKFLSQIAQETSEKNSKRLKFSVSSMLLPARASKQGNVIGLVSVYIHIYMSSKKIVVERTRDLI